MKEMRLDAANKYYYYPKLFSKIMWCVLLTFNHRDHPSSHSCVHDLNIANQITVELCTKTFRNFICKKKCKILFYLKSICQMESAIWHSGKQSPENNSISKAHRTETVKFRACKINTVHA